MRHSNEYAAIAKILSNERLPYVAVDLDAFDRNLKKMGEIARSHGKRLRLATKSVRVPALIERVLSYGPPFVGLMCFAVEEVEKLASLGHNDFLVAYPTLQSSDLAALRKLHEQDKKVALVVDCAEHLEILAAAMKGVKNPFRVVFDVDASLRFFGGSAHFGVRRSPLRTIKNVADLLDAVKKLSSLKCVGAMVYEAQVAGLGDRNPFKKWLNPIAHLIRKMSIKRIIRLRAAISELFQSKGVEMEIFNGGGTGSLNIAAEEPWLTELSAGSGLLCSHLFDYYSNIQFEPSCVFALQAVRSSDEDYVTCLGGGYVASGEPGWDRLPKPVWPEGLKLTTREGTGEVQTPLTSSKRAVRLGQTVFFRHAKAGELAERFNEYILVNTEKSRVSDRVKTDRGLGWTFF